MDWFQVDKQGLAQQIARKGKGFVLFELYQNAVDAGATEIAVQLVPAGQQRKAHVTVIDNSPTGFLDLAHAYTMFAPSQKKSNPNLRGRFNIGEKFVLALCDTAQISTTSGSIVFDSHGRDINRRLRTGCGTKFYATMPATKAEIEEMLLAFRTVLVPLGVKLTLNEEVIIYREPVVVFNATLQTEFSGDDGELRRSIRATDVQLLEVREGEAATIYELGVPVVESGDDKWHYNVMQRVPLTIERDNVPPSYLRALRTFALNATADKLKPEDATQSWVREAAGDERVQEHAFKAVQDLRWGEKRVLYDPSDPEANKIAVSLGYKLVYGGSQSRAEHENTRRFATTLPAGKVTPSPQPYGVDGDPMKLIPLDKWTDGMKWVDTFAQIICKSTLGKKGLQVQFTSDITWPFSATYGPGSPLTFNVGSLGPRWFNPDNVVAVLSLLLHEFAHDTVSDHLSRSFANKIAELGALLYVNEFHIQHDKTAREARMPKIEWPENL